jgi:DNA-binding NtrC family response regulator
VDDSDTIGVKHLPGLFKQRCPMAPAHRDSVIGMPSRPAHDSSGSILGTHFLPSAPRRENLTSLTQTQTAMEREMVVKALTQTQGHVTRAAGVLGISRQLLHYKLKKYGIDRKSFI